ncbi:ArsR/SmtB family transcription factor [Pseudokordiimonas caeni]|uniref:ArsR/SmtB family transcription factor n=1 Tax=Pseudokordiimonas caeni TaxID=2997908 RepID=UPI002811E4F5|nr:metalloregulator ArsR/SmtB family transcription factor [Pseudokordiimonas caeni]
MSQAADQVSPDVFAAVADPTRRGIVELLALSDRTAGELAAAFPALSRPAVAKHIAVLQRAGLVETHSVGRQRVNRLKPAGLSDVITWTETLNRYWDSRLDTLKTLAEEEARHAGHRPQDQD